jgi:hypothetical protein
MIDSNLMTKLEHLSRIDKLRVIRMLAEQVASEEASMFIAREYEVWSPYNSADAAHTLTQLIEEDKQHSHG